MFRIKSSYDSLRRALSTLEKNGQHILQKRKHVARLYEETCAILLMIREIEIELCKISFYSYLTEKN